MTARDIKSALRQSVLAKRNRLPEIERIEMSLSAAEQAHGLIPLVPGEPLSAYFPIRSEIDPRPLMHDLRQAGARLCLPIVQDRETILFRELVRGEELIDTGFGTRGPGPEAQVLDPTVMIMPLSVFDGQGNRIGYGAGHYDRAIARLYEKDIKPILIGLAFALQEISECPAEPHDQPLDAVITENGLKTFSDRLKEI